MSYHTFFNNGTWALEYHYGKDRGAFRICATQVKGVRSCNATIGLYNQPVWDSHPPLYIRKIAELTAQNRSKKYVNLRELQKTFGD